MNNLVITIGDSSHNTLSAVRSFGEAKISQTLLLICEDDLCQVRKCKYLRSNNCHIVHTIDDCMPILERLSSNKAQKSFLITTFDEAAEWVDKREEILSRWFETPCRGKQIGNLFDKHEQCLLATKCGFDVPYSFVFNRSQATPLNNIKFPIITKPLISSKGSKGDIHICYNLEDFHSALSQESHCKVFIIQEYIEKEYEIDAIGVSTENGVIMGGAVRKYRHWPKGYGAGAYGLFDEINSFNIDIKPIESFLRASHYYGPFSIELLHTNKGRNFFMEVNFRNEGLAYASTCAGINLHAYYVDKSKTIDWSRFKKTYLMNYSIDFLYVKDGSISFYQWLKDFLKTRCFINICFSDLSPVISYYKEKIKKIILNSFCIIT